MALLTPACRKNKWIEGRWVHVDETGKPGMCLEFTSGPRKLSVFRNVTCQGTPDPMLSGKWQLKDDKRLAVQRGRDEEAQLVLITDRKKKSLTVRGALSGSLHRLDKGAEDTLLKQLREQGVVKRHMLADRQGCQQLGRPLEQIRALPVETAPRMLRSRDQGLQYYADKHTTDPNIEKVVYALNQDQVDWIAFYLAPQAFAAPGPTGRLEQALGQPVKTLTTGSGEDRQNISMWRSYCPDLRGAYNQDVDVTLFATAGKKQGLYYVSAGVIAELWEELSSTVAESAAESQGAAQAAPAGAAASPPPPAASPPPPAASPPPPPTAAKAPARRAPRRKARRPARRAKPTGRPVVPGDDDI